MAWSKQIVKLGALCLYSKVLALSIIVKRVDSSGVERPIAVPIHHSMSLALILEWVSLPPLSFYLASSQPTNLFHSRVFDSRSTLTVTAFGQLLFCPGLLCAVGANLLHKPATNR